jgi:hypothetical protein
MPTRPINLNGAVVAITGGARYRKGDREGVLGQWLTGRDR